MNLGVLTDLNSLLYMRARYYAPELKRFINEDIVTGDISNCNTLNRYTYVEGNPVSMIDPFGLCAEKASKFCNSELGFKVGLDILKTAGGIALAVFVPGAQGIGISMAISGASGLILDGITAFGVEMDAKTSSIVGNTVQIVAGAGLMLNPSTAAYGASEIGSGLGGLIGGYVGETAYKAVTGEESDKAYLVGASLGNIAGGYVGDSAYKSFQNIASKSGSNTKTLFRGDRASVVPDDVFQNGFKPKGTHNDALLHTKSNTTAGNFVSTSGDKTIATEFAGKNGYVYEIQTDNYVDINSTYGAGAYFPEQMEFSIPGGIKPSEIVGAYKKQGGKIIGDFIPNPNFGGN